MEFGKYKIVITFHQIDELYEGRIPELEGCSVYGDTPEEAIKELRKYFPIYLDHAKRKGIKIPEPRITQIEY